jgi:hypothetical protein
MGVHLIEGEVHDIDMNNGRIAGIKVIGLNGVCKTSQVIPDVVTSHHRGGRLC